MKYGIIAILALTAIGVFVFAINKKEPLKPHEKWWSLNVEKMLDTFHGWLGDTQNQSRVLARKHIQKMAYQTILDVPCGTCIEYYGYKDDQLPVEYTGLDITPFLAERGKKMGLNVLEGSIERMPFKDSSFDLVYIRHLLEHLDYYELALNESIRVGKKEIMVVFFLNPSKTEPDQISPSLSQNALLYHNRYNREKLSHYLLKNPKVKHLEWEEIGGINGDESILHVYLI